MSMELWVLSDKKLDSIREWQSAIGAEGYTLALKKDVQFENLKGFLPCQLNGQLTGFECYHDDPAELMRNNSSTDFGRDWKYALGFRWLGSKENETLAAWMAGTAYARATGGIVANDQDTQLRPPAQSAEVVRDLEQPSKMYAEAKRELRRRRELKQ
jgi:hypothetical protein